VFVYPQIHKCYFNNSSRRTFIFVICKVEGKMTISVKQSGKFREMVTEVLPRYYPHIFAVIVVAVGLCAIFG
jgi:hypothetical protein